jgi:hypothetical protein
MRLEPSDEGVNARKPGSTCWICAAPADTSEHVFKAAQLRRYFDAAGTKPEDRPFLFHGAGHSRLRGANADVAKYSSMLCARCNNVLTAPHDAAYDLFYSWCERHQGADDLATVDFSEVFGTDWREGFDNFRRYCAKSLGCRMIASDAEMAPDFPHPLTGAHLDRLQLALCRNDPFQVLEGY